MSEANPGADADRDDSSTLVAKSYHSRLLSRFGLFTFDSTGTSSGEMRRCRSMYFSTKPVPFGVARYSTLSSSCTESRSPVSVSFSIILVATMLLTFAKSMMWLLLDGDLQQLRMSAITSSLPLFFAWEGLGADCLWTGAWVGERPC